MHTRKHLRADQGIVHKVYGTDAGRRRCPIECRHDARGPAVRDAVARQIEAHERRGEPQGGGKGLGPCIPNVIVRDVHNLQRAGGLRDCTGDLAGPGNAEVVAE